MQHVPLTIGNDEIAEGGDGTGESFDPATNEVIATFALASTEQADQAVAAARKSFDEGLWRGLKPFERARVLMRVSQGILDDRDSLAKQLTLDSGKPLRDSYYEVDCSARFFEFYAGLSDKLHGSSIPLGPGWMDWTVREPIGVSLHIVPWNYQLLVAVRGIAPALAAGCSIIVKPSTETPLVLLEFARISASAGLPAGVLNIVTGRGSTVGDHLARHRDVDQLTFTGSVTSGIKVIQAAATHTIPTTMELGGKSPQLLFADANMASALETIVAGMYTHAGQVCNAGTRLFVEGSVHDQVVEELHKRISDMTLGHGLDDPDMGPVVSKNQKRDINAFYELAKEEGELLLGAELPTSNRLRDGNFVRPALVVGAGNKSRIAQTEVFGPLLTVIPFSSPEEAIAMANETDFGLVAGVFTSNIGMAMESVQSLNAGQVYVNCFGVGLDVEFPFGGYKNSGYGREKGVEAVAAYLQTKNVCVGF